MLLEFCAENFTKVPEAIELGAQRIELCDNLPGDGTTPSYAVLEHALDYAKEQDVATAVMIRPRGGDFVYSDEELTMMMKDVSVAKVFEAEAVVFGCLTEDQRIDRKKMTALLAMSGELETVFHMAFDHIAKDKQKEELDWLIKQGVTRVLMRGGVDGQASDHIEWLQEIIDHADGRIEIVVGGGVTHENYEELAKILPTNQFHGTRIVDFES